MISCSIDISPTNEQTENLFDKLPKSVQEIAYKWGMNDTVFRDYAYESLMNTVLH